METKNKLWLACIAMLLLVSNAFAQTTTVNGLVVVVNFKDYKIKATMSELSDMFNKPSGFNLWGNETSVREYFKAQTNNKIDLINTIISVDLNQNSDYYVGDGVPGNLTVDVINAVNQKYPAGFTNLTLHPTQNRLYNFSIISQSANGAGYASQIGGFTIKNNGQDARIINFSHVSWKADYDYDVNTICHEYGHAVWNWTDYYRTGFCNLGMFDVMASAGSDKSAMPINPALRMQRGWVDTITNIPGDLTATYSIRANNAARVYRYVNPANPKEYLIFQALKHDTFFQAILNGTPIPEGLAIWYVDEEMGYGLNGQDNQYVVRLVQADNLDQMHDEDSGEHVHGDMDDFYGNGSNSFPNGHPWRWKDGGEFGITLSSITRSDNYVNITVTGRTRTALALSDINGTLTPRGTVNVTSGTSQTFTFLPDTGYELDAVLVNDLPVAGATSPYTLTGISTTPKTIQPVYKKKATIPAVPSPWQKSNVGTTGLATYDAGKFSLEAEGGSILNDVDNFTYVYQTINGNGTIIAHLASSNKPNDAYRAGIMIRASLQPNAVQTMLVKAAYDGYRIHQRTATGNALQDASGVGSLHIYNLYNWVKITRTNNEFISYCSRDGVNWIPVAQQTINMPAQALVGICVAGGVQYYPAKAAFDNVSINTTVNPACTFAGTKIAGSSIGSEGAYGGGTATREKAFDGNILNYYDGAEGQVWTGLSLTNDYKINGIRFFPRRGFTARMVGGKFQGSNTADFSTGVVDLATVTTEPAYDWNCITISNTTAFRYIRYICPAEGWGNVSEIEFYGSVVNSNQAPTVSITSPVVNTSFNAPATITINANATDSDGSVVRVEFYNGSTLLGTDVSAPYSYTWSNVPAGVYSITALAVDNLNANASYTTTNISVISNTPPTVSITSPVANASFTAPATIIINANATDADGSVVRVEFYNGSTLLGTDVTAPYSYTWNNVAAGVYNITALAIDNLNANTSYTRNGISVVASAADITGPACASNNTTITYELAASKRVNATGYGWYFTGSTQSFTPSSTTPYQATLVTGNNYAQGQLCVGVSFASAPYYVTYCITLPKCSASREGNIEEEGTLAQQPVGFPNPFKEQTTINLENATQNASVQVYNASGVLVKDATAKGTFTFGEDLVSGIYFVKIITDNKTQTLKLVKE